MLTILTLFCIATILLACFLALAHKIATIVISLFLNKQFNRLDTLSQMWVLSLAQLQTSNWITRIMSNGTWQHYEIHRYYLPETMTWSYTPAEGVVSLKRIKQH